MLTEKDRIRLKAIYDKYNLIPEDVWEDKETFFKIISKDGIRKIRKQLQKEIPGLWFDLNLEHCVLNHSVVKCTPKIRSGTQDNAYIDVPPTFGEAAPDNSTFFFPTNVAEKRALSRMILEIADLYAEGFRGEEEMHKLSKKTKIVMDGQGSVDNAFKKLQEKKIVK